MQVGYLTVSLFTLACSVTFNSIESLPFAIPRVVGGLSEWLLRTMAMVVTMIIVMFDAKQEVCL